MLDAKSSQYEAALRSNHRIEPAVPYANWPVELRRLWHDTYHHRIVRELRFLSWIGLATCLLCLLLDAQAGLFEVGATLRLSLVTPAYLLGIRLLSTNSKIGLWVAANVPAIVFVGVAAFLGMHAGPEHQDNYLMAASMLISICIILSPVRLRSTIGFAILGFSAIAMPIGALSDDLVGDRNLLMFAMLCCSLPLLIKQRGDRLKDTNFLLTLESRRAQDDLLKANRELEELSDRDPLTGLLNRRGFEKRFQAAFDAAVISGEPLAVLLIDLDYFKNFNDTYGHQAGDECLRQIADLLNDQILRNHGIAGRYGGEEFIAALNGSYSVNAITIAEGLRREVARLSINTGIDRCATVTVSIGARIGRVALLDQMRFIEHADHALYAAKKEGRNQVVLYSRGSTADTEEPVLYCSPKGKAKQLTVKKMSLFEPSVPSRVCSGNVGC